MPLAIGIGIDAGALGQGVGVPEYLVIDGALTRLLAGTDGLPLMGADGQYLYGVV